MSAPPRFWSTTHTEFLVACDEPERAIYRSPVDAAAQQLLQDILQTTLNAFQDGGPVPEYEFAEQYETRRPLRTSVLQSELDKLRHLLEPSTAQISSDVLEKHNAIAFYMARFTDDSGNFIIGVRRASYFKAILKQRNRMVRFVDDTLTCAPDQLFKLDPDFDFLMTNSDVYILRPGNFEAIADVDDAIIERIPEKLREIAQRVPFIDLSGAESEATKNKRMARLVASVAARNDLAETDVVDFLAHAAKTEVEFDRTDGRYSPKPGHIAGGTCQQV